MLLFSRSLAWDFDADALLTVDADFAALDFKRTDAFQLPRSFYKLPEKKKREKSDQFSEEEEIYFLKPFRIISPLFHELSNS